MAPLENDNRYATIHELDSYQAHNDKKFDQVLDAIEKLRDGSKTNWSVVISAVVLLGGFNTLYISPVIKAVDSNAQALASIQGSRATSADLEVMRESLRQVDSARIADHTTFSETLSERGFWMGTIEAKTDFLLQEVERYRNTKIQE